MAALVMWAVQRFMPEVYAPARLIVGAVALIAILWSLLKLIQSGSLAMP